MKYKAVFKWSKLRSIPKIHMFIWICLFLFVIAFGVNSATLFTPLKRNIEETNITISNARLYDSRDIWGSRFKLIIDSQNDSFYLWYPVDVFPRYENCLREKLLTGETTAVYAKVVSNSILWDTLSGQRKIVDLRTDSFVFYDLEDELLRMENGYNVSLWAAVFSLILWLADTVLLLLIYRCVRFVKHNSTGDGSMC